MRKLPYHHGDLRKALIDEALRVLSKEGIQGLSLRKVAKEIGVSHNAPYQHFRDKEALIAAIAHQGFVGLSDAMTAASPADPDADPRERLIQAGQAYVGFMADNPAYLDVMFGPFQHTDYPELSEVALAALEQLVDIVRDGQARGRIVAGNPREIAGTCWMVVHGFSVVFIAQKVPQDIMGQRSAVDQARVFIENICDGVIIGQ